MQYLWGRELGYNQVKAEPEGLVRCWHSALSPTWALGRGAHPALLWLSPQDVLKLLPRKQVPIISSIPATSPAWLGVPCPLMGTVVWMCPRTAMQSPSLVPPPRAGKMPPAFYKLSPLSTVLRDICPHQASGTCKAASIHSSWGWHPWDNTQPGPPSLEGPRGLPWGGLTAAVAQCWWPPRAWGWRVAAARRLAGRCSS